MFSESASPTLFFSRNYREGRQRFREMCTAKGLDLQAYIHTDHKGPCGEDLAIDCAWFGPQNAEKVMVISCGTHGLEASTGAATIMQFLHSNAHLELANNTALLIIYPVNPFGWAYDRRGNEDGVDLNRNCLDHTQPYPVNAAYDELHPLIKEAQVDPDGLETFIQAFHAYSAQHGLGRSIGGITAGQYTYPNGMSYGGNALSWSCRTLYTIVEEYLRFAKKIVMVDWHTGIGAYGKPYFIMDDPVSSRAYAQAKDWWAPHTIHSDDILDGASPDYSGLIIRGLKKKITSIGDAETLCVVIEWGTYKVDEMLQSLLLDDWLKANYMTDTPLVDSVRTQLIDRFCPQDSRWRDAVLSQAPTLYQSAITGLTHW